MTITVEAIYEDGVLKPSQPLPFQEREHLQITVAFPNQIGSSEADIVRESYGLLKWSGTHEELQKILDEADEVA